MAAPLNTAPLTWGPDDSQQLREMLRSPFGRRFAFALLASGPPRNDPSPERVLGRIEGYEHATAVINQLADSAFALAAASVSAPPEMYPDLDDAAKWPATLGGAAGAPAVPIQTP